MLNEFELMPIIIRIDTLLARRKMTLIRLSQLIDMNYNRLVQLKLGNAKSVKIDTIIKICDVLGCKPGDIFDYVEENDDTEENTPLPIDIT